MIAEPPSTESEAEYLYRSSELGWASAYILPKLRRLLPAAPTRILDLGCGNGSLTDAVRSLGHQVIGVDGSASGIAIAQKNYPHSSFIRADITELPDDLRRADFDVVLGVEVIEHLLSPRSLVGAAQMALKPGGRLILTTPYHGYLKNLVMAVSGRLDQHFTVLWEGGHVKFFSVRTLRILLQSEGFDDLHFAFAGRVPLLWKSMLCSARLSS